MIKKLLVALSTPTLFMSQAVAFIDPTQTINMALDAYEMYEQIEDVKDGNIDEEKLKEAGESAKDLANLAYKNYKKAQDAKKKEEEAKNEGIKAEISEEDNKEKSKLEETIEYLTKLVNDTIKLSEAAKKTENNQAKDSNGNIKPENNAALKFDDDQQKPLTLVDDFAGNVKTFDNYKDCIQYRALGTCFFLKPSWPWPKIRVSVIGENYYPDQHIEVTASLPAEDQDFGGDSGSPTGPLLGGSMQSISTILARTLDGWVNGAGDVISGAGSKLQKTSNQSESPKGGNPLLFREAMVIGNPTAYTPWQIVPGFCKGSATAMVPYFNSGLDILSWRIMPTTEMAIAAVHSVQYTSWNTVQGDFGVSVFPRVGHVENNDPYRASVAAAFRASSIVNDQRWQYSGEIGLHIHSTPGWLASGSQSRSKFKITHDHKNGLWREVFPRMESSCTDFNWSQTKVDEMSKGFKDNNPNGALALKLYRPFICCSRKGAYLWSVDIADPNLK